MSAGSSAGGSQFRMNTMSHGWQPQIGQLTGLPIIPCPRCGDRVLELRMGDDEVFFKCRQNDQDVPPALRKCKFYKLTDEYEGVLVSRGYGHLIGASMTQPRTVEQAPPRYVEQTRSRYAEQTPPRYVEQTRSRYAEQSYNPNSQENMKNPNFQENPKKMEDTKLSAKMNKLIKLGELILFSLVALVVLVSLGLVVIVLK